MAWSSAEKSAAELALFAADIPMICSNAIPEVPTYAEWTTTGTSSGADISSATLVPSRAYDGYSHVLAAADSTADTDIYFNFDFSAAGISFDAIAIMGHNFDTLASGGNPLDKVSVEISDTANFSTATEIAVLTLNGSGKRVINWSVFDTGAVARRFSAVRYARLVLHDAANFSAPSMGEIMFLRSYPMDVRPNNPFNPDKLHSEYGSVTTSGGITHRTTMFRNQFILDASFAVGNDTYINNAINFYKNNLGCFVWCWQPTTYPNRWHAMILPEDLDLDSEGYTQRNFNLQASEQGPESKFLASELAL